MTEPLKFDPPLKFGTVQSGNTETMIKRNYPRMYEYMKQYSKEGVDEAIDSIKDRYPTTLLPWTPVCFIVLLS